MSEAYYRKTFKSADTVRFHDLLFVFLVVSLPFYYFKFPKLDISVTNVVLLLVTLAVSFSVIIRPGTIRLGRGKVMVALLAILLVTLLSFSTAINEAFGVTGQRKLLELSSRCLYFLVPFLFIERLSRAIVALRAFAFSAIVVGISTILVGYQILTFTHSRLLESRAFQALAAGEIVRNVGLINNFGDLTILSAALIVVIVGGLLLPVGVADLVRRLTVLILVLLLCGTLFMAQSRNLLLVSGVAGLLSFLLLRQPITAQRLLAATVLLAGSFTLVVATTLLLQQTLHEYTNAALYRWGSGRLQQYTLALDGFSHRPLLGHGYKSFEINTAYSFDVHNIFVELAYSGGIITLMCFVGVIVLPVVRALRSGKEASHPQLPRALFATLLPSILAAALFYPALTSLIFWFTLRMTCSLPYIVGRRRVQELE